MGERPPGYHLTIDSQKGGLDMVEIDKVTRATSQSISENPKGILSFESVIKTECSLLIFLGD